MVTERGDSFCCLLPPNESGRWPQLHQHLGCSKGVEYVTSAPSQVISDSTKGKKLITSAFDLFGTIPLEENPTVNELITFFRKVCQVLVDGGVVSNGEVLDEVFESICLDKMSRDSNNESTLRKALGRLLAIKPGGSVTSSEVLKTYLRISLRDYDKELSCLPIIPNSIPQDSIEMVTEPYTSTKTDDEF
jgi:hypothetical protein